MKPQVTKELQTSWIIFGLTAVISVIFLSVWWDWGAASQRENRASQEYDSRTSRATLDLEQQVRLQQQHNVELNEHIEELKAQTGMRSVQPFIAPDKDLLRPGQYFQFLLSKIREDLSRMAGARSVSGYNPELGFGFLQGRNPEAERVPEWLDVLQLTAKAMYLALNAPANSLSNIEILDLGAEFQAVPQAPEGRSVLLNEYRFTLQVTGSLRDILWLQHQLVAEVPTPVQREMQVWLNGPDGVTQKVYASTQSLRRRPPPSIDSTQKVSPLVLLGLDIDSPNMVDQARSLPLTAQFELAGMAFVDQETRDVSVVAPSEVSGFRRRAGVASP